MTDIIVWVPSNFSGCISVRGAADASFSRTFIEQIFPSSHIDLQETDGRPSRSKSGDCIEIRTGGRVAFRVWDVLTRVAEPEVDRRARKQSRPKSAGSGAGEVWRRMFGVASRPRSRTTKEDPRIDWDFLIEDQI